MSSMIGKYSDLTLTVVGTGDPAGKVGAHETATSRAARSPEGCIWRRASHRLALTSGSLSLISRASLTWSASIARTIRCSDRTRTDVASRVKGSAPVGEEESGSTALSGQETTRVNVPRSAWPNWHAPSNWLERFRPPHPPVI